MKKSAGFTLIELIVVIVILGILAATALPKFIDFKGDAANAAAQGVAGALGSATAMNYAKFAISSGSTAVYSPVATGTSCASLLNTSLIPSANQLNGISATGSVVGCTTGAGSVGTCQITNTANGGTQNATATITCLQ